MHIIRKILIGFLVVFAGFVTAVIISSDKSPIGHWKNPEAEHEYKAAYEAAMKKMPTPTNSYDITIEFGVVRVYKWENTGNKEATPIILFPGRSSGVPMWYLNISDFCKYRTVYALDALGDAGLSLQTKQIKNSEDQAKWIEKVFDNLNLNKINAIGHSFGGWLVANYASYYPKRIKSIVLLEPVFTFQPIKLSIIIKSIPYSIPFLPKSMKKGLLEAISGTKEIDTTDPIANMISIGSLEYVSKLPTPEQITIPQIKSWLFPAYSGFGGKSSVHDSVKAYEVAKKNIRSFMGNIWKQGSHSLPMEFYNDVDSQILIFLQENN